MNLIEAAHQLIDQLMVERPYWLHQLVYATHTGFQAQAYIQAKTGPVGIVYFDHDYCIFSSWYGNRTARRLAYDYPQFSAWAITWLDTNLEQLCKPLS